jgi:hypothetical protein
METESGGAITMWISKKEFEALKDRVKRLENEGVLTEDRRPDAVVWPGVRIPVGFREISAARAVSLIAKHLKIRFRYTAEQKPNPYIEEVPGWCLEPPPRSTKKKKREAR